jgi:hypothetical protein
MNTTSYPKLESSWQSGIGDLTDLEIKIENTIMHVHNGYFYDETTPYWLFGGKHYIQMVIPSNAIYILGDYTSMEFIWNAPVVITPTSEFLDCAWEPTYNYVLGSDNYIYHQIVPTSNVLVSNEFYLVKNNDLIELHFSPYQVGTSLFIIYDSDTWYESTYIVDGSINYKLYDRFVILHDNSNEYPARIDLGTDIDCTISPSDEITLLANVYDRFGAPLENVTVSFAVYPSNVYYNTNFTSVDVVTNAYGEAYTTYVIPTIVGEHNDIQVASYTDSINPVTSISKQITDTKVLNIAKQRENNA